MNLLLMLYFSRTCRYIWLAQRFSDGVFVDLPFAFAAKEQCEERIEMCLVVSSVRGLKVRRSRRRR